MVVRARLLILPLLFSLLSCKAEQTHIELLLDDHRSIEFQDIQAETAAMRSGESVAGPQRLSLPWKSIRSSAELHQGFYGGRLYIRLTLADDQKGLYRIRLRNPHLEHVDCFNPATGQLTHEGVLSRSRSIFPSCHIDTAQGRTLLLRVDSRTPYRLPVEIIPQGEWTNVERLTGTIPAFVSGAAMTLLAYHFLLWRRTRDWASLFFLPYLVLTTLYRLTYHGLLTPLLKPDHGHLQLPLTLSLWLLANFTLLLWTKRFLRPLVFGPAMQQLTNVALFIVAGLLATVFFDPYLANIVGYAMSFPFALYLILIGFSAARVGYGPAFYFGLSVLAFPLSILLNSLLSAGMTSLPGYVEFTIDLSFFIQILLMAFAIVDGIHSKVQQANDRLESEVRLRTAELQTEVIERKRSQEVAEEANRAKTRFLANVSHEIRTPMNVILGINDLLKEEPDLQKDKRDLLDVLHRSGKSLIQILDDILQTSRIELGQIDINEQPFELRSWLEHLCAPFEQRLSRRGVHFRVDIEDVPNRLIGDSASISQILGNLLSNAAKFTENGSVRLLVRVFKRQQDHILVQFSVIDTGIGIPEEDHENLFTPFSSANARTAPRYGGTGLGLSIAQSLTKLLKGTLTFQSTVNTGSEFTLTLPFRLQKEKTPTPNNERFLDARILLAEDQPENRFLFDRYLRKHVRQLVFAEDGEQAVSTFASSSFDLVLMDIRMPVMDGYEAYMRIRDYEANQGRSPCPVLALTAHAMEAERQRLNQTGFDEILTKPVQKSDLLDAIERHLGVVRP